MLLSPTQCALDNSTINDRTLTTFYLPPGTERALHITSQTTTQVDLYTHWARSLAELLVDNNIHCTAWTMILTSRQDVIRVLLRKFRVADNPHKYALYERQDDYRGDRCVSDL